jgi:hypothetical protein
MRPELNRRKNGIEDPEPVDSANVAAKQRGRPFEKGKPRPPNSGRRKGTPNKMSAAVRARLEELGCDPIEGLAMIAMDEDEPSALRAHCFADLMPYCYAKKTEHSGSVSIGDLEELNQLMIEGRERLREYNESDRQ